MTDKQFTDLEELILRDGCISPLVVWSGQDILLNGHNRKARKDYSFDDSVFQQSLNCL